MSFGADTPHPATGTPEVVLVDERVVACDGGSGQSGHPLVYLRIAHEQTFCPWCSRIYRLNEGAGGDDGH